MRKASLLLIIFILSLIIAPSFCWYNTSFKYRQEVIVNSSKNLSNYQVLLELNESNVNSSFNWSNKGLLFTRLVNNTEEKINYWIESWNASNKEAKVWIGKFNLTKGKNYFWMYYGNPNATDESNYSVVMEEPFSVKLWENKNITGRYLCYNSRYNLLYTFNTSSKKVYIFNSKGKLINISILPYIVTNCDIDKEGFVVVLGRIPNSKTKYIEKRNPFNFSLIWNHSEYLDYMDQETYFCGMYILPNNTYLVGGSTICNFQTSYLILAINGSNGQVIFRKCYEKIHPNDAIVLDITPTKNGYLLYGRRKAQNDYQEQILYLYHNFSQKKTFSFSNSKGWFLDEGIYSNCVYDYAEDAVYCVWHDIIVKFKNENVTWHKKYTSGNVYASKLLFIKDQLYLFHRYSTNSYLYLVNKSSGSLTLIKKFLYPHLMSIVYDDLILTGDSGTVLYSNHNSQEPLSTTFNQTEEYNTPPTILEFNLTPSKPKTLDNLTCIANATDAEQENLTYSFYWYINGNLTKHENVTKPKENLVSSILPYNYTKKNQNITCKVVVSDGKNQTEKNKTVSIVNTPPEIALISPPNDYKTESKTLTLKYKGVDPDNDTLIYKVYVDNTLIYNGTNISISKSFSIGKHNWYVTVSDGENFTNSSVRYFEIVEQTKKSSGGRSSYVGRSTSIQLKNILMISYPKYLDIVCNQTKEFYINIKNLGDIYLRDVIVKVENGTVMPSKFNLSSGENISIKISLNPINKDYRKIKIEYRNSNLTIKLRTYFWCFKKEEEEVPSPRIQNIEVQRIDENTVSLLIIAENSSKCRCRNENENWSDWKNIEDFKHWNISKGEITIYCQCKNKEKLSEIKSIHVFMEKEKKKYEQVPTGSFVNTYQKDLVLWILLGIGFLVVSIKLFRIIKSSKNKNKENATELLDSTRESS